MSASSAWSRRCGLQAMYGVLSPRYEMTMEFGAELSGFETQNRRNLLETLEKNMKSS